MVTLHIWLRKKAGMSDEEFRDYWLTTHAPIARDGYEHLRGYVVHLVTRVPQGQDRPYDGVAELTWEDREGYKADLSSETASVSSKDLENFTDGYGPLFVDRHVVK